MALIKCKECNKDISDKATICVHCGCPIEKELICIECGNKIDKSDNICKNCGCPINDEKNNQTTNKKESKIFARIWLILCIILCLLISYINIFNIFHIEPPTIIIGDFAIIPMGVLALILGISYFILLITFSRKALYLLLGINAIVLLCNLCSNKMEIELFYMLCVIFNSLITFFVVRKKVKGNKSSFKEYLPVFIVLVVVIVLTIVITSSKTETNIGNDRDYSIPQIEIVTDYINIRSSKDSSADILGQVHYGEIYTIISEDEESSYNWYEIETENGIKGFIAGKYGDTYYVRELEIIGNENNGTEEKEEERQEETTNKPNTTKPSNNTNNNSKPNNSTTTKTCNESAKQQLTNEYNSTLEQRTNEYNTNINKVQQQINFAKEALDTTGGYLSASDYETQYQQATSQTQKEILKNRYSMSVNYDKMVNTYNSAINTFNSWKSTYNQWYQEELSKIGC